MDLILVFFSEALMRCLTAHIHTVLLVLLHVVQRWTRHINMLWSFSRSWWMSWESLENKITLWLHRRRCWRGCAQNRTSKSSTYTSKYHTRPGIEGTQQVGTTQTPVTQLKPKVYIHLGFLYFIFYLLVYLSDGLWAKGFHTLLQK